LNGIVVTLSDRVSADDGGVQAGQEPMSGRCDPSPPLTHPTVTVNPMILGVIVGLAVGLAVGVALYLARAARLGSRARVAESRLADSEARLSEQAARLDAATATAAQAETARAVAASELAQLRTSDADLAARADEERSRLAGLFAELSADALAKNNEQFLALAGSRLGEARTAAQGDLAQRHQAIAELLAPLSETLARYERGLHDMEVARQGAYQGLTEKVAQLHHGHEQLARETRNLVTALRSPQTRGRWGEVQLRRVAEMAGMLAHCDFDEQVTTVTESGRLRPDMVVHMPGGGEIVVDAKVPLEAFLQMLDADDDDTRALCQAKHARLVRTHVDQLANKEYWKQFETSPQMVVAFIPGDQLLAAAFDSDPTIQEYAMANGVLLTTPVTLIALLRTVALGWQQETLAENAREVQTLGAELYDRLRVMAGHMRTLQRGLTSTVKAYNDAVGSLESRVLVSARRFPDLGIATGESSGIAELAPVEAAPRHLQAVELPDDEDEDGPSTILALPEGQATFGLG
jgi:DNA recombination protein RmuC